MSNAISWQDKAEWLRSHGYALSIHSLETASKDIEEEEHKWMAFIWGEGRRYGFTIEEVINQVYAWVKEEIKNELE